MNRNFIILSFALITLYFSLFSCSQEIIEPQVEPQAPAVNENKEVQTRSQSVVPNFEVVNGHLKFQSESDYIAIYNSLLEKVKMNFLVGRKLTVMPLC